ncbi:MAG TPA: GGDEF domain-containing protein [bacterium]|nr:GGDEF domain-containing protein [bacterium]
MTLTTPLPYTVLMNQALPGFTPHLRAFDFMAVGWDGHPLEARIQALDDTVGILKAEPDGNETLIHRVEREVVRLVTRPSQAKKDTRLLSDISQALRALRAARIDLTPRRASLELSRLITRPLNSETQPGLMIRGPARLFKVHRPHVDPMEDFGRMVHAIWSSDPDRAREIFQAAAFRDRPGEAMHVQTFAITPEELERKTRALAEARFEVHAAPIPFDMMPARPAGETLSESPETAHWIVGRRTDTPLELWFREFVDKADKKNDPPIGQLDVLDRTGIPPDDSSLQGDLRGLFGRPLSWEDIRKGFAIDVPKYVTRRISLRRHDESGGVSILTEIATRRGGEIAARLYGWLPPPPADGQPWIAWGEDLNEQLYGLYPSRRILQHIQQGIGRRALTRTLVFLHRLGVNALDMNARGHGLTFMPGIGFDFRDDSVRRKVLDDFHDYVKEHDSSPTKKTLSDLLKVRQASDILDYQNDRGEPLGRAFLEHYAQTRKETVSLRFWLNGTFGGWRRLFSRQLALRAELDFEEVSQSDRVLAHRNLMEEAESLTKAQPSIDLDVPEDLRRLAARRNDLILHLLGELEQARTNADLDSLTQLLNRRALMRHNAELERSLSANRKGDAPNGHYVLMVDIDFFKKVNDTFSYKAGDQAIARVAQVLKESIRDGDLVCRWGGEEFVLILKHSGRDGAANVAERIRQEVERKPLKVNGGTEHPLTVSIGFAPFQLVAPRRRSSGEFNPHEEEPVDVENSLTTSIAAAETGLKTAKRTGRNRVVHQDETAVVL